MTYTRGVMLGAAAASVAAAQSRGPRNWKPKVGILMRYSESHLELDRKEEFTSLQHSLVTKVEDQASSAGLYMLMISENHTSPDPAQRAAINKRFTQTLELASKLGVPYIGAMSGNMPGRELPEQVNEQYFPL